MINMHPDSSMFAGAKWIWPINHEVNYLDNRIQARKEFSLDHVPSKCEIRITADSFYILYVNGQYVTRGPARGFHGSWPFDRVDIAPFLAKGKNVLAVMGYQYGTSTFTYLYANESGILIAGTADGVSLNTDSTWKVRKAPGYSRGVARLSLQLGFQELYDASPDPMDGWKELKYNDGDWATGGSMGVQTPGAMPWHSFEERGIPQLTNDLLYPEKVVAKSVWQCAKDFALPQNLVKLYCDEKCEWMPFGKGDPGKLTFAASAPDEARALLLDFGREVVGPMIVETETALSGGHVDLLATESLSGVIPDLPDPTAIHSRQAFGNRLKPAVGKTRHEFLHIWGFRYLLVAVRGNPADIAVKISLRQTVYPLKIAGSFESSEKRLNDIWNMCVHTQKNCMLDAYVDCPWREQAQWWGDACVQARNTFALAADSRLLARGIRQLGTQKTFSGLTYGHAPTSSHYCILPDFSLTWIVTHWLYYWQTGDLSLFVQMKYRINEVLEYFRCNLGKNGLLSYDDRYWLFLDWCPDLHRTGVPTVLNLQYLLALRYARQMAEMAQFKELEIDCRSRADKLLAAIQTYLYDRNEGVIYDGIDQEGKTVKTQSPHTAALAILLDIFPESHDKFLDRVLLPLINSEEVRASYMPSSFFMYYIFEAV
ncbi:MAG: hypothetical protein NT118_14805, partial [Lentisphaerae bacterium]|nr:hypothetical protein [Lentisphaerota bacterium]